LINVNTMRIVHAGSAGIVSIMVEKKYKSSDRTLGAHSQITTT
jgi:hypothetical protein